jgi:antitoxin component YwqK of YwqJK toxin-antitoxin module
VEVQGDDSDTLRVADSELEFDSDLVMHYRGQPFTGVAFERAANGAYCELAYVEGLQHGVTREWDAEGRLRATETWDANTRHGVSRTYDDHGSVVCEQWWNRDQQM